MIRHIPPDRAELVIDTLCEAFYEYPVMRYVIGPGVADFDLPFRRLIRLFVMARVLSGEPLLGIGEANHLHAAAAISLPDTGGPTEELLAYRAQTWAEFTPAARQRYDDFCEACNGFDVTVPHHHLNMVGVREAHQGRGLAGCLVRHVIDMAEADPRSGGVSLSTESVANVPFYQHLGFELTGHAVVGPGLETWNFFRPGAA